MGDEYCSIRTADYQSYYTHSGSDVISLDAQGGADGTTAQTMGVAPAKAGAPDMMLAVATAAEADVNKKAVTPPPSVPETAEPDPTKEMNWWFIIGGSLAGALLLSVLIWQINKYHY